MNCPCVSRLRAEASRPENITAMRLLVRLAEEFEAAQAAVLPRVEAGRDALEPTPENVDEVLGLVNELAPGKTTAATYWHRRTWVRTVLTALHRRALQTRSPR